MKTILFYEQIIFMKIWFLWKDEAHEKFNQHNITHNFSWWQRLFYFIYFLQKVKGVLRFYIELF